MPTLPAPTISAVIYHVSVSLTVDNTGCHRGSSMKVATAHGKPSFQTQHNVCAFANEERRYPAEPIMAIMFVRMEKVCTSVA